MNVPSHFLLNLLLGETFGVYTGHSQKEPSGEFTSGINPD